VLTAARGMRAAPPCRMPCERPRQRAGRRPSSTAPPGTRCTAGRLARAPARSPPQSCCSPRCSSQRSARRACGPRARAPPPLRSWAALQRAQSGRRRVRTAPSPSQPGATRRYAGAHAAARHAAGRPPGPGPPAAPAQPGARPLMPLAPVHQVDRCGCLRQRRTVVVLSCSSGAGSRQHHCSALRARTSGMASANAHSTFTRIGCPFDRGAPLLSGGRARSASSGRTLCASTRARDGTATAMSHTYSSSRRMSRLGKPAAARAPMPKQFVYLMHSRGAPCSCAPRGTQAHACPR